MKKIIIYMIVLPIILMGCFNESKKDDLYTKIKNDQLFKDYIKRFKKDNVIFSDQSIYFDKVKKRKYFRCYNQLFPSESCDYRDHEACKNIEEDLDFYAIVENKCKKGKLMIELKEKYPEMNKKMVAKLINNSFENGFAVEILKNRKSKQK